MPQHAEFPARKFIGAVRKGVDGLELKDRVSLIASALRDNLPADYPDAVGILQSILDPENPNETGMFTEGYWVMPIANFVEQYGIEHPEVSFKAVEEITKRNTGEYAIRPFFLSHLDKTIKQCKTWSTDNNFHVRRLACEGMRPRLPWAKKLDVFVEHPELLLAVLNNLKDDESKYVQKSVGNSINDVLKDNYDVGMSLLTGWTKGATKQRTWIIKHALRNQLKKNNPEARSLVDQTS